MIHIRNVKENASFVQIFTGNMKDFSNVGELFQSDLNKEGFIVRTDGESWFSNKCPQKGTCCIEI